MNLIIYIPQQRTMMMIFLCNSLFIPVKRGSAAATELFVLATVKKDRVQLGPVDTMWLGCGLYWRAHNPLCLNFSAPSRGARDA